MILFTNRMFVIKQDDGRDSSNSVQRQCLVGDRGLGGTDLYVYAGKERYTFRESAHLIANVHHTPVLDGSGLKNSLERKVIHDLAAGHELPIEGSKVLLVCAVDRFGMAEALLETGAKVTFGDLIFGLNINKPLYSLKALSWWAKLLAPIVTKLPVSWFYPMGKEQEKRVPRHPEYFRESDIIAGFWIHPMVLCCRA